MATALAIAAASLPAAAHQRPGRTDLVSLAYDGTQGIRGSEMPSISADGRYVAFISFAENLVPGGPVPDPNYQLDVFVRDRQTGTTERVPVGMGGGKGDNVSDSPAITGDGRFVAFRSFASNLVPGDTNGGWDIFVADRWTGTIERVSVGSGGAQGNDPSVELSVSGDGRYVAFTSYASNLVPGDVNGVPDVFVRDRQTGTTTRVSVAPGGSGGNGESYVPSLSADGRYVAFTSSANDLVPGDLNGMADVFVRDRQTGTTVLVSVGPGGEQGNGASYQASISGDGRVVAFNSEASNLVPSDTDAGCMYFPAETFARDLVAGTTERVSVTSSGAEAHQSTWARPSISGDGRYVAYNQFVGFCGGSIETFLRDRETGTTEWISFHSEPYTGGPNDPPTITPDGRFVAFQSRATNLVPVDTNNREDVFVRDRARPVDVGELVVTREGDQLSISGWATFSGQEVTSASDPPNDGTAGAQDLGAELTGASLVDRPEEGDLLVRLTLARLPSPPLPAVSYQLEFTLAGTSYQVRAVLDSFALFRCDPVCVEQASLSGAVGTTGADVRVSVPLPALGAAEGAALTGIRASTSVLGSPIVADELALPDVVIPTHSVRLGIAPAGAPEGNVPFGATADLGNGFFSGTIDISSFPSGQYDVWARACLGAICGSRVATVDISSVGVPRPGSGTDFALAGPSPNPTRGAARIEYALPREAHVRIGVYDLQGREVSRLVDATRPAGWHALAWGAGLPPGARSAGIYFVRMESGGFTATRRLVLMR